MGAGIRADYANGNIIGGEPGYPLPGRCEGDCNLIVGNSAGITITQAVDGGANRVIGNFIGIDVNGATPLSNPGNGVWTQGVNNTIANNLISGNTGNSIDIYGVAISNSSANTTTVQGNLIGVARDGVASAGNGGHGVWIYNSDANIVGGAGYATANTIAFNRGKGVVVSRGWASTTGNRILGNSIHSNGSLGIDLGNNGVTLNDATDSDTGPNNLQNFPIITGFASSGGNVLLTGTLTSTASSTFRLEFFANDTCDPSRYGEGRVFLGYHNVTTNGSGRANFGISLPNPSGKRIFTATATDPDGNTSEFSMCVPPSILLIESSPAIQIAPEHVITYTVVLTYHSQDGSPALGSEIVDPIPRYTDYRGAPQKLYRSGLWIL